MQLYECQFCRQMVEVLVQGPGSLSCCGSPLKLLRIGRVSPSGCREQHEPPIDLLEVVSGGKSCWEFPKSREPLPENDRLQIGKALREDRGAVDFCPGERVKVGGPLHTR